MGSLGGEKRRFLSLFTTDFEHVRRQHDGLLPNRRRQQAFGKPLGGGGYQVISEPGLHQFDGFLQDAVNTVSWRIKHFAPKFFF